MKINYRVRTANSGKSWTVKEEEEFIGLCRARLSGEAICKLTGRTMSALENRALKLRREGRIEWWDMTWRHFERPLAEGHAIQPKQKLPWPEDARFDGPREYRLRQSAGTYVWNGERLVRIL